jgi:hypothetical protein
MTNFCTQLEHHLHQNALIVTTRRKNILWTSVKGFVVASLLALALWKIITGGIGFYPNVEPYQDRPCGGYHLNTNQFLEMSFGHCFVTNDSLEQVDEWYRERGWFKFGEQSLPPALNLGLLRILVIRYFLTENQHEQSRLIVQSVQYQISPPCSTCLSGPWKAPATR